MSLLENLSYRIVVIWKSDFVLSCLLKLTRGKILKVFKGSALPPLVHKAVTTMTR